MAGVDIVNAVSDKHGKPEIYKSARRFDYSAMSPPVSKFLRGQAERIRRQHTASIIQIGKALIGAKRYLCHGEFIGWVETEACIPARTAQVYMRVAQWACDKSAAAALLPPAALHVLSAPSAPNEFVRDILNRVDAGEHITSALIRKELKAIRDAKQQEHDQRETTLQGSDNIKKKEINAMSVDANDVVGRAIVIMARGLSTADFEQVRALLTSKQLLDELKLAHRIAAAFLRVESAAQKSGERDRQSSVAA